MAQSIRNEVITKGYAFVQKYCPDMNVVAIAMTLGQTMAPWEGRLVQELVPRASAEPNTYSGIYGLGSFPFHTDLAHWRLPPRYLLLRCAKGYADVPTLLLDGQPLFEGLSLDILARAIVKPRRPRDGEITLFRLCEPTDDGYRLRWDEVFLKPASKIGETADRYVRAYLTNGMHISIALQQVGDMLLIDNWRMLHARAPIAKGREDRKIERVYLERLH